MKTNYPIDFVVTWLDSNDPVWLREYGKYRPIKSSQMDARYRYWAIFKYWFRAVEKNAPWINRIYIVTCGHYPKWLRLDNPKIVLVKHSDYIPEQYLPTFNSRCIELNFGRIKGLSEHFIYFNDDMFLNSPITPDRYFKNGLPLDFNYERVFLGVKYNPLDMFGIELSLLCNTAVLNYHFNRKEVVASAPDKWKWYSSNYTLLQKKMAFLMRHKERFEGFTYRHTEQPFLKSVFEEIWEKEPVMLDKSCTKFRTAESLTPYFVRYWQFASNRFEPFRPSGEFQGFSIREDTLNRILQALRNDKILSICLNDNPCNEVDFYNQASILIQKEFERKYPEKSSFEL